MTAETFTLRRADTIAVGDVIWLASTSGAQEVLRIQVCTFGTIRIVTPCSPSGWYFAPENEVMVRTPERAGALL